MAGPLDIDDDTQRMVLRMGEARDSGQDRRVPLFIAASYNV